MNIPNSIKTNLSSSATIMLSQIGVPQERIDAATRAFFKELEGDGGYHTFTNAEPLDRSVNRETAASILGVTKSTISKMVGRGTLRAVYGGKDGLRLTGISEASIRSFMENSKKKV